MASMDLLGAVVDQLPTIVDTVIYGSVALTSAVIYGVSFFGIVGTYYRDSSPLLPPTRALQATLSLMAPLAAILWALATLTQGPAIFYSPVRMLASLCGTPMLLWLPAAALTSHHDFRLIHMAVPPAEAAAAAAAAEPKLSSSGATGAEESVAAAEPATGEPAGSKKED